MKRIYHQMTGDMLLNVIRYDDENIDEFDLKIGQKIEWPEEHIEGETPSTIIRVA